MALVLALAAANFLWQLGSSSYFIDEVYSIREAAGSLGHVLHQVRVYEFNPWTYFVLLHEWIGHTGSQAEWVLRLPSAVAAILLVLAVLWMSRAFVELRPALLAAVLCALSPLVLEYAQQARAYAFAMLAVTVAVGATVRAASPQAVSPARRRALLGLGVSAGVAGMWFHYSSALVLAVLCAWLLRQRLLSRRARAAFVTAVAAGGLLLAPLFLDQSREEPHAGIGPAAGVNWGSVLELGETPFDTRAQTEFDPRSLGVGLLDVAGVLVLAGSLAAVGSAPGAARIRERKLLIALTVTVPVLLVLGGLDGKHIVNKRYAAVAAPFMLTLICAAGTRRRVGPPLVGAALVVCAIGTVDSHRRASFYSPAREAIARVNSGYRTGDVVGIPSPPALGVSLVYYVTHRLRPVPALIDESNSRAVIRAMRRRERLWLIAPLSAHETTAAVDAFAERLLGRYGYHPARVSTVRTASTFAVVLAAPTSTR